MPQLIVTYTGDDEDAPTPDEFRAAVQHAIDSDLRCPPAQADIPG